MEKWINDGFFMFEVFVMNGIEEKGLYEYLTIYMCMP